MSDLKNPMFIAKSQEQIALELMEKILLVEGKSFNFNAANAATKDEIMNTYRACLRMIKNPDAN